MSDVPPVIVRAAVVPGKGAVFVRRLSSTVVLWGIVIAAIVTGNRWLFFGLIAGFGALSLVEWCRMFGGALPRVWHWWLYLVSAGYAAMLCWSGFEGPGHLIPGMNEAVAIPVLMGGLFCLAMKGPLDGQATLWRIFGAAFGFIYIPFLLGFAWRLLFIPTPAGDGPLEGVYYLLFVIAVTKFTDMGAYFVGMLVGKHKMIPHISPGKTWEGFGGGFLGALVAGHGLIMVFPDKMPLLARGYPDLFAAGLALITVVADLAESVVKRCLGAKDSGHMLPGIGGALDLIDSLLFTAPAAWIYLKALDAGH